MCRPIGDQPFPANPLTPWSDVSNQWIRWTPLSKLISHPCRILKSVWPHPSFNHPPRLANDLSLVTGFCLDNWLTLPVLVYPLRSRQGPVSTNVQWQFWWTWRSSCSTPLLSTRYPKNPQRVKMGLLHFQQSFDAIEWGTLYLQYSQESKGVAAWLPEESKPRSFCFLCLC